MIKAIIFDCLGVLFIDPWQYFIEFELPEPEKYRRELDQLKKQYDFGFIDGRDLEAQISDLTGLQNNISDLMVNGLVRNTELFIYIRRKRSQGYKVGLLSNIGTDSMRRLMPDAETESMFDTTVLSGVYGKSKPDPDIYTHTANNMGLSPDECLFIDDSPDNCEGARIAGMQAVEYYSVKQTTQQLEKLLGGHQ